MLPIKGIYENGKIKLLEAMPKQGRFDVIVTFLEDRRKELVEEHNLAGLLSDLNEKDFNEILACYTQQRTRLVHGKKG